MATYTERLKLVQDAIDRVLVSGSSVSYAGRSWTAANLTELRKLEAAYQSMANQEIARCKGRNRITYVTPIS